MICFKFFASIEESTFGAEILRYIVVNKVKAQHAANRPGLPCYVKTSPQLCRSLWILAVRRVHLAG